jgi:processive 1,2-diacylglycerol beta-glucosyltransferase/1,2-diacylglycerol 3-beta-galactosyltransferase
MNKPNFIFLYLKTGGGHLAPARSLSKYLNNNYSDKVTSHLVDGFEKTPHLVRYIIEDGYRKLQAGAKWYYEFLYALHKVPLIARITAFIVMIFCRKYIEDVILKEKPSKIIILHFFLIQPVYYILRKHNLDIETYTVVTDPYTAHPLWFFEREQNFIVFSSRIKEYILEKKGCRSIQVFPFLLDEKFSSKIPEEKIPILKEQYGIPFGKKVVLILGGGDGIPHGKKILNEILKAKPDAVIIVVCGRNKRLLKSAKELQCKYGMKNFIVFGFVDFVYELLNISDIVVTKCGASTMMEILMMKKVAVVNDYIWEQEKGNIEFLISSGFGLYEPDIRSLVEKLELLIKDNSFYQKFRDNINHAGLRNGTAEAAEFLIK